MLVLWNIGWPDMVEGLDEAHRTQVAVSARTLMHERRGASGRGEIRRSMEPPVQSGRELRLGLGRSGRRCCRSPS